MAVVCCWVALCSWNGHASTRRPQGTGRSQNFRRNPVVSGRVYLPVETGFRRNLSFRVTLPLKTCDFRQSPQLAPGPKLPAGLLDAGSAQAWGLGVRTVCERMRAEGSPRGKIPRVCARCHSMPAGGRAFLVSSALCETTRPLWQ